MPGTTTLKMNTVTENGKVVFFFPPIDGFAAVFNHTAAHLSVAAYGCQYTDLVPSSNVQAMAKFFASKILPLDIKSDLIFCAQWFGVMVANSVASEVEQHKVQVEMLLLDGRPAFASWYPDIVTSKDKLGVPQICNNFLTMYGDLDEEICNEATDDEAMSGALTIIARHSNLPESLIRAAIDKYGQRVESIHGFGVDRKMRCNITLVKTSQANMFAVSFLLFARKPLKR